MHWRFWLGQALSNLIQLQSGIRVEVAFESGAGWNISKNPSWNKKKKKSQNQKFPYLYLCTVSFSVVPERVTVALRIWTHTIELQILPLIFPSKNIWLFRVQKKGVVSSFYWFFILLRYNWEECLSSMIRSEMPQDYTAASSFSTINFIATTSQVLYETWTACEILQPVWLLTGLPTKFWDIQEHSVAVMTITPHIFLLQKNPVGIIE